MFIFGIFIVRNYDIYNMTVIVSGYLKYIFCKPLIIIIGAILQKLITLMMYWLQIIKRFLLGNVSHILIVYNKIFKFFKIL